MAQNNTHIKLTRCTTMCFLIKETDYVRVGISANNETKPQLAKLYFEVQINKVKASKGKGKER